MLSKRELITMDTECYKNYWLIGFKHVESRKTKFYQLFRGHPLNVDAVLKMLNRFCVITFNGNHYDMVMTALALAGAPPERIKSANDRIIVDKIKPWDVEKEFEVRRLRGIDHIDLKEVAPGGVSLKLYGGRMHSATLQDLPIEPSSLILPEERPIIVKYNLNDLDTNIDMLNALRKQLELRVEMGNEYGLDLRSKSDAQIAEAVIVSQVERRTGRKVYKSKETAKPFKYDAPHFIEFKTPYMQGVLEMIKSQEFKIKLKNGKVEMPDDIANMKVAIGGSKYTIGIGGLHSKEKSATHHSDENFVLIDRDFRSFYPEVIWKLGLYPKQLGKVFLNVYREIIDKRIAAKAAGNKVVAESLKIVVNGSFGKFGEAYSRLYSPHLMIQTTVTGQLMLLMLIEAFELEGIQVVSANTDGIVMKCPREKKALLDKMIHCFEFDNDFVTEETEYKSLHSRDVNNYIAIKPDGEMKLKGAYGRTTLAKNPTSTVCIDAVLAFLTDRTPFEQTIAKETDIRKFLNVRQVDGGALFFEVDILPKTGTQTFKRKVVTEYEEINGALPGGDLNEKYFYVYQESLNANPQYLGKVVRWYFCTRRTSAIRYKTEYKKVSLSEGSQPMMKLVEGIPDDLDYERYIKIAQDILVDLGINPKPVRPKSAAQLKREHNARVKKFDAELEEL